MERIKCKEKEELVSIIMPAYNSERFIDEAIKSVINQSYQNWELIIVNDCSTDDTEYIVKKFLETDSRIKYYKQKVNIGTAMARNKAKEVAKGTYIAFLDSDDVWKKKKLEIQINFMKKNNYNFTCTKREVINEKGERLNRVITVKNKVDYNYMLLLCPIGNSTVIYNAAKLGRFTIPNVKKSNDYVLWLQILKVEKYVYGLDENLSYARIVKDSLSSNKASKMNYHWKIYRKIENLSIFRSVYLMCSWGFIKLFKIKDRLFINE